MAKKSKGKSVTSPDAVASSSMPATGTSTALASSSTSTTNNGLESSTGSIASTSTSKSVTQNGNTVKEVRSVAVSEETDVNDEDLPDIQVNKSSLHDLKTACDDAVKQVNTVHLRTYIQSGVLTAS